MLTSTPGQPLFLPHLQMARTSSVHLVVSRSQEDSVNGSRHLKTTKNSPDYSPRSPGSTGLSVFLVQAFFLLIPPCVLPKELQTLTVGVTAAVLPGLVLQGPCPEDSAVAVMFLSWGGLFLQSRGCGWMVGPGTQWVPSTGLVGGQVIFGAFPATHSIPESPSLFLLLSAG
ncbi:hypothetical protein H1C71_032585 [Ictidomys tridecemlineatus]|nr:hypothetical protein H1C71_032585 [Ictidomys tridecemlineatus]